MSLPDRNNPYTFDAFLEWRRRFNYYLDDEFFQRVLRRYAGDDFPAIHEELKAFSGKVSYRWRDLAEAAAVPEKRPYVVHYDGHNHRIDRIVRPMEVLVMEKEVFSEALFSKRTNPWLKLAKMYLIYQNGEACIACPLTCTEGLVALLERFADTPETRRILMHCSEGIDGDFGIGAQYLSEIQGGSDVPANLLEAVEENGTWRLYGKKFFCSATHADYAVVTAKPAGSEKVALFVVPSWLEGDKEKEIRNGCTIDRIKLKMGTSELTTAEITYNGAKAYPVGPLDRGVANVVGIVLTYSRLTVGLSGAAGMTRGAREAKAYASFRDAFGVRLEHFPMLANQLEWMDTSAKRTTAGAFMLYREFLGLEGGLKGGLLADEDLSMRKRRFCVRELIMLQKITASWDATDVARMAMSVFGGHGVMEDFSSLPRMFRDAAINELWEGPRNVLLTQMHRDFQRAAPWYAPGAFVRDILKGADTGLVEELAAEMELLTSHPSLFTMDDKTKDVCRRWDSLCHRLFHAYQDLALAEVLS
ncbi:MAG TPA: acyl-CoA dehydrogenase family protein [Deltaproteobacteria bacterium]|nr:acyl-CoA dehydrogenase family protein [Deltaproteobacteria bacterium]HOM28754.1 acyl-CoA dehydrogenase family protein [Deltaproteobacteria bacterium]HPP81845.1 acyl-CoA dehydrogenase family protein [Deltaproteobacteria bacterium]